MKSPITLLVLIAMLAGRVEGQTFTTLHNFTSADGGALPIGALILSSNVLYGTTEASSSGNGMVFAVNIDGTGFTNLHNFRGDGIQPHGLVLSDNTLYGTTWDGGGRPFYGTVFALKIDGTGFTNLHGFSYDEGYNPNEGLVLSGGTLYGTTWKGPDTIYVGTVFSLKTDGADFTNLHLFGPFPGVGGASPYCSLTLLNNTLYGTTQSGPSSGLHGTVFAMNLDGTGFTNLYSFSGNDGDTPEGGLTLSETVLYGTTYYGGISNRGTLFAVNIDGTGFTNLHNFTGGTEGSGPVGSLILSGSVLYGTTGNGGASAKGTVFGINIDGTGFTTLHSFRGSDGVYPKGGLIVSGNVLYGTTYGGGISGGGTIFTLFIQPQLAIIPAGESVVLTWPTNYSDFVLQSTTNLLSPVVWTTNSVSPVVVNGQNIMTNRISSTHQFYRLSR